MATHKRIPELTQSDLARYAGRDPETVRKALAREPAIQPVRTDGRSLWYAAPAALERILCGTDGLSATAERARLDAARADAQELKNAEARGELVRGDQVEDWLIRLLGAVVQRIRAVPPKAAPEVRAAGSDAEAEALLAGFVDEALHELGDAMRNAGEAVVQMRRRRA